MPEEKATQFYQDCLADRCALGRFIEQSGNPEGLVKAWEVLLEFPAFRVNQEYLNGFYTFRNSNGLHPTVTNDEIIDALNNLEIEADQRKYLEHLINFNNGNHKWGYVDFSSGSFNGSSLATFFDARVSYSSYRERVGVVVPLDNNILEFHVNIPQELQQQWLGSYIVKQSIKDYNPSKVKGRWKASDNYINGESINLTIYRQKISDGFSPQDAALETPTGKILKENGFGGTPTIILDIQDEVIVQFNPG